MATNNNNKRTAASAGITHADSGVSKTAKTQADVDANLNISQLSYDAVRATIASVVIAFPGSRDLLERHRSHICDALSEDQSRPALLDLLIAHPSLMNTARSSQNLHPEKELDFTYIVKSAMSGMHSVDRMKPSLQFTMSHLASAPVTEALREIQSAITPRTSLKSVLAAIDALADIGNELQEGLTGEISKLMQDEVSATADALVHILELHPKAVPEAKKILETFIDSAAEYGHDVDELESILNDTDG